MRIQETNVSGIKMIDFQDENDFLLLRIAPDYGAKIMVFNGVENNEPFPILWEVGIDELKNNVFGKNDILFPFPNRLSHGRYHYGGNSYQFPINEVEMNNSIHGFIREKQFFEKSREIKKKSCSLHLAKTFHGEPYYPFPFHFEVSYYVENGLLKVTFSIKNTGSVTMPFGLGWHPYFNVQRGDEVFLPELKEYLVDNRYIPTGDTRLLGEREFVPDGNFFNATYEVTERDETIYKIKGTKDIEIKASKEFGFLQLYTPLSYSVVAIEPMTCCIDSFNNGYGLLELEPLEAFKARIQIKIDCR